MEMGEGWARMAKVPNDCLQEARKDGPKWRPKHLNTQAYSLSLNPTLLPMICSFVGHAELNIFYQHQIIHHIYVPTQLRQP